MSKIAKAISGFKSRSKEYGNRPMSIVDYITIICCMCVSISTVAFWAADTLIK